ncbi:MAG: L-threonine 3-dehydrogenase [Planctomycetes bacterium]|nr:L-threonine 3-dehydrogenase [Planctomycetota bacterium]
MKALVKKAPREGLWLDEVPVPGYGIDEVLVKIHKTGICGTDVHIYNWDEWSQKTIETPMVIGHEFVGEVVEVGSNVKDIKPGDHVSGEGHIVCGRCRNCLAGRRNLCPETKGLGVNRDGAFAEYLSIPVTNVWVCSPRVSEETYAYFDPLGNAVHTALSFDVLGEDVLITGAGPIGIMAVAVARHAGARFVVITDVNDFRLDIARKMGATLALNVAQDNIAAAQKQLGMHEGFDIGLEMSGNPLAFRDMIANMAHGGKIAALGIQPADTGVDWNSIVFGGLTIKGIYGREMYETWYKMTMMIETGMDVSAVVTHRLPYVEFEKGFEAIRAGKAAKVVLDWESV